MTISEFYQQCVEHGYEDFQIYKDEEDCVWEFDLYDCDINEIGHRIII